MIAIPTMTFRRAALTVLALASFSHFTTVADRPPVVRPAAIPGDYALLYSQQFDGPQALRDFVFTDPGAWRHSATNGVTTLELVRQSKYAPPVRSPVNIALLSGRAFGDFTLDVDLIQTGKEYGHRDMCLFFGLQNPTNFYYVHLATKADNHAHNIFVVTNAPRVKIARETTAGVNWGLNVWHKVRLERRLADGSIKVYFDDLAKPVMVAEDKTFGLGAIGFGSFDDTGMVDNIRLWSPSVKPHATAFFRPAGP
jgi:hypothetical protein